MKNFVSTLCIALLLAGALVSEKAAAQELESARAVLEANVEATGGFDAWNAIKDMYTESEIVIEMQQGVLIVSNESWRVVPGYLLNITEFVDGPPGIPAQAINSTAYVTPDGGYVDNAQGRQNVNDLPEAAIASFRASSAKDEIDYLALPDSSLAFHGTQEMDGEQVYVVELVDQGGQKLFYSTSSNLLVAREGTSPMGGTVITRVSEYDEVGDVMIAFIQEADLGQIGTQTVEVQDVEINTGLTPEALKEKADEIAAESEGK